MNIDRRKILLSSLVMALLLPFQNCGMSQDEVEGQTDSKNSNGSYSSTGLSGSSSDSNPTYNLGGTLNVPLPGQGGSSSSGGNGHMNLGGGGNGGGGLGQTGGGGSGGNGSGSGGYDDDFVPYEDKYRKTSLYPDPPGGSLILSQHSYYFEGYHLLNRGTLLWNSYRNAISAWTEQQMGTEERKSLIVISYKHLSLNSNKTQATYGVTGTSLCYKFSASLTLTAIIPYDEYSGSYYYHQRPHWFDAFYTSYRSTYSAFTITPKSEEEMTLLESSACKALAGYDRGALDSFVSYVRNYTYLSGNSSSFSIRSAQHYDDSNYYYYWDLPFKKFN